MMSINFWIVFIMIGREVNCEYQRFGCRFKDSNYFLNKSHAYLQHGGAPIALKFKDKKVFGDFLQVIQKVYDDVMDKIPYDNVLRFLVFYKSFLVKRKMRIVSLLSFYNNYQYEFVPGKKCVGLAIEIFNRLDQYETSHPGIREAAFLASGRLAVDEGQFQRISIIGRDPFTKSKTHTVGVYKVFVAGSVGYIVLETGLGVAFRKGKEKSSYTFLEPDKKYIVQNVHDRNNDSHIHNRCLIYIGQRYCSFMQHSDKRDLLNNFKAMVKRVKGVPQAGFSVELKSIKDIGLRFAKVFHLEDDKVTLSRTQIIFPKKPKLALTLGSSTEERDLLRRVDVKLLLLPDVIYDILEELNRVMNNDYFVRKMQELNIDMSLEQTTAMQCLNRKIETLKSRIMKKKLEYIDHVDVSPPLEI